MAEHSQRPRPPVRYPVKILNGTLTLYITEEGSWLSRYGNTLSLTLHEEEWLVAEFERVREIVRGNTPPRPVPEPPVDPRATGGPP